MGGGRIYRKNLRDTSFNKDLSNEPNFGRIHLAGQYGTFRLWEKKKVLHAKKL